MKIYNIDFFGNRKKYFTFSILLTVVGIVFNIIFGTKLDMQFTGGAVIKYSYQQTVEENRVKEIVEGITKKTVNISMNKGIGDDSANILALSFAGTDALPLDQQKEITNKLEEQYPEGKFSVIESSSINPSMGRDFLFKCLACIALAIVMLIIYIALRFRKIGGTSAGVMAIISLLHDITMVYFAFIIFRMPLNDNFIAVVLTVLGYSLNDTIIIYDRIRENRKVMGPKVALAELVNTSINQTLLRSIYTVLATVIAITTVYIFGLIYNIYTIQTFALPMLVGVVTGCYSSICVAGPLYVMWENRKARKMNASDSSTKK